MDISIATLNLCLGLLNKKEEVKRLITEQKLDVLCMQETELPSDYPARLLSFRDYQIQVEVNSQKSRVAVYIKNCVKFTRRYDLEGVDSQLVIIDIQGDREIRLINIYRSFNHQNGRTQKENFVSQLQLLKTACTANTIIDFNLDHAKRYDVNYRLVKYSKHSKYLKYLKYF